jgi:hypothetical protein
MRPENHPLMLILTGMASLCLRALCRGRDHRGSDLLSRPTRSPNATSGLSRVARQAGPGQTDAIPADGALPLTSALGLTA